MLEPPVMRKLESIRELPAVPLVISEILNMIDHKDVGAGKIASLIEKDQSLTARVLKVANSPYYGFSRRIATVDLAVVVMGLNTIKEILLGIMLHKFVSKSKKRSLDIKAFWEYSVFCASAARLLSRKLGYRLAGEAFVAGLMHDIGVLIISEYFTDKYNKINMLITERKIDIIDAEEAVLGANHCEIGAWIAEKWNLPRNLVTAIRNHHTHFSKFISDGNEDSEIDFSTVNQPLTAIVSLSEWFAHTMGKKSWRPETTMPEFYLSKEVFDDISDHELLTPDSAFKVLQSEIEEEFQKASIINDI